MRILTGRRADPGARRHRRLPAAVALLVAALALLNPVPATPAAAAPPAGPDWMPWTGPAELWCTWGNPSPGGFCTNYHSYPAMDVGMARNTPIYAAGPGTVRESANGCREQDYNCQGGRGNFVALAHPDGRFSRYLHLTSATVGPGQSVTTGQLIGYSGATGSVCRGSAPCPHLHYDELTSYWNPMQHVDPGPMHARHGHEVVSYPQALGKAGWPQTPYGTRFRHDGWDLPPAAPARFRPLPPSRVLDSRANLGWSGALQAGAPRQLQVGGVAGVPPTATAVVLNVTATGASNPSYLTVFPAGVPTPQASNLNYEPGTTIPNLVTVRVAAGGRVAFTNGTGRVDVVADVVGYYDESQATDAFAAVTPTRVLDSRDGTGGWPGRLAAGTERTLTVRGTPGVPPTATAVVLNVTAAHATNDGYLRVYPTGGASPPATSSLNFRANQTIANLVVAPIGPDGKVAFGTLAGTVDVIADITGYFAPTAAMGVLHAISPTRVLDNRAGIGVAGKWFEKQPRAVPVAGGSTGIPADATAVIVNVTATNPTADSYLTVYPDAGARPLASNLGFAQWQTIPNLVMVRVGAGGTVQIYNDSGTVDVVADVVGYFTNG